MGRLRKQYQVRIDPVRLIKHELTFEEVIDAIEANNRDVGGGTITDKRATTSHSRRRTHGKRRTDRKHRHQVARRSADPRSRCGERRDRTRNSPRRRHGRRAGRGGARPRLYADGREQSRCHLGAENKLDEIKATLPAGVQIQTVYDRTELVDHVIHTVQKNLFEGGLLVVAVLFIFLGNLRAGTDCGAGHPAFDAVLFGDAAGRYRGAAS